MFDFEIINPNYDSVVALIIMKTADSPLDYWDEITDELTRNRIQGTIIIDELLHSGNNEERFISGNFDGNQFVTSSVSFMPLEKKHVLRKYMCEYLKQDQEFLQYSSLTEIQQKLILRNIVI